MNPQSIVVVVGSINTDFVLRVPRLPRPGETVTDAHFQIFSGGKGANQAVAAARLGARTLFIGKVGRDGFGARLRRNLRAAGVRVSHLLTAADAPSGMAFVVADAAGQNAIVVSPGANRRLTVADLKRCHRQLAAAGVILVQLEIPLPVVAYVVEFAARRRIPLILDAAPARRLPRRLLRHIPILTANETEAPVVAGPERSGRPGRLSSTRAQDLCRRLLALGPQAAILKLGERGALVGELRGRMTHIPALRVQAVDSTAAGDAFNGALAVALLEGKSVVEAARFAAAAGAFAVTRPGAQPSLPTRPALRDWLRRRRQP
ncbi:MAG: ribokinase [Terriglobia bacterium]